MSLTAVRVRFGLDNKPANTTTTEIDYSGNRRFAPREFDISLFCYFTLGARFHPEY